MKIAYSNYAQTTAAGVGEAGGANSSYRREKLWDMHGWRGR